MVLGGNSKSPPAVLDGTGALGHPVLVSEEVMETLSRKNLLMEIEIPVSD